VAQLFFPPGSTRCQIHEYVAPTFSDELHIIGAAKEQVRVVMLELLAS